MNYTNGIEWHLFLYVLFLDKWDLFLYLFYYYYTVILNKMYFYIIVMVSTIIQMVLSNIYLYFCVFLFYLYLYYYYTNSIEYVFHIYSYKYIFYLQINVIINKSQTCSPDNYCKVVYLICLVVQFSKRPLGCSNSAGGARTRRCWFLSRGGAISL